MNRFFIFLLLIPFFGYSQNESLKNDEVDLNKYKNKEVILIWYANNVSNQGGCSSKAIIITSTGVVIDTCYSMRDKEVSSDITQTLDENDFYTDLLVLTKKDVRKIQTDLEQFKDESCEEYSRPVILIISDKKGSETYGLKNFKKCYPEKSEDFMKQITNLINSIYI